MRFRILAAAIAAAAALAACGSSTSGTPVGNGKPVSNAPAGVTTHASGGGAKSSAAPTGGGGGGGGGGAYCDTLKSEVAHLSALESNDDAAFLKGAAEVVAALQKVDASAPSDIKPAWDKLVSGFKGFLDALSKAGITPEQAADPSKLTPAQIQAMAAAGQSFATADFASAATKITADVKARCGLDLGDDEDSGAPTPSST